MCIFTAEVLVSVIRGKKTGAGEPPAQILKQLQRLKDITLHKSKNVTNQDMETLQSISLLSESGLSA